MWLIVNRKNMVHKKKREVMVQRTYRASQHDIKLLGRVAKKLKRSKSEVVRMGITLIANNINA